MLNKIKQLFNSPHELRTREDFRAVYEENKDFIRTSIFWMVRNQDIDDIVQEAFVKAWQGRESFKGQSNIRTWLYRIAMNCAHDHYRKLKFQTEELTEEYEDTPSVNVESYEKHDLITQGLEQLSWEQREVFILFYKLEMEQKEIAAIQGVPVGTVKSRLNKAKKNFTEFVKSQEVTHAG
jgi:RNA polymerase sigma-70 factor (ECF subfamily)